MTGRAPGTTTLAYHDVVDRHVPDASGFAGADAARYKLDWALFRSHLDAIASSVATAPVTGLDLLDGPVDEPSWSLTFDDGGASASQIASELTARGWRGQFFVTTNRIDTSGFLTKDEIRALDRAGHVVGAHSHTHPQRMSECSPEQLHDEWRTSVGLLAELLGHSPVVAAIPGGWYSKEVAAAAAAAGVRALYTSEPVRRAERVGDCLVLGRYALLRTSRASTAGGLAAGAFTPRAQRRLMRLALKPVKRLSGDGYLRARESLLRLRDR